MLLCKYPFMTKMYNSESDDIFKKKFKYYKSNKEKPCLEEVLRIGSSEDEKILRKVQILQPLAIEDPRLEKLGLTTTTSWEIYSLRNPSGLVIIRNPFTPLGQRYWIQRCLGDFPKKPNRTNIDYEVNIEDWWQECFTNNYCDRKLQKKLRWTTMGYHHNWDTKVYSEDNKSDFPSDLASLCVVIAHVLGQSSFRAEAAIINYYHMDSTLSPHTDHSEVNLAAPLFSFSFGQSAIFLIGGADKSVEPTALLLQSGDVVVMSGDARLSYHAVPKIVRTHQNTWNAVRSGDASKWQPFNDYIAESRINMNVRQVLCDSQHSLLDSIAL